MCALRSAIESGSTPLDTLREARKYQRGDLPRESRRYRIAHLMVLRGPGSAEKIILGEGLKTRRLPDGKTPTLRRIGVDVIVTVFRYM